jgi:hypothetical protein
MSWIFARSDLGLAKSATVNNPCMQIQLELYTKSCVLASWGPQSTTEFQKACDKARAIVVLWFFCFLVYGVYGSLCECNKSQSCCCRCADWQYILFSVKCGELKLCVHTLIQSCSVKVRVVSAGNPVMTVGVYV